MKKILPWLVVAGVALIGLFLMWKRSAVPVPGSLLGTTARPAPAATPYGPPYVPPAPAPAPKVDHTAANITAAATAIGALGTTIAGFFDN